jgi:hypothetical protein
MMPITSLYAAMTLLFHVVAHWIASPSNILGLLLVAASCYYLFRPAANAFFSGVARPIERSVRGA